MPLHRFLTAALLAQRGHLFVWLPICFGSGIGSYFYWRWEPGLAVLLALLGLAVVVLTLARWTGPGLSPLLLAVGFVALGHDIAAARAHLRAAPVLQFRYYGPVEGRIVAMDRSGSDALRLTLDRVVLDRFAVKDTPKRVRVALHGDQRWYNPQPDDRVILTAHLSPPSGPAEPGGFDFQRHAWFQQIGAVGYTRTPVLLFAESQSEQPLFRLRQAYSERVQVALPGVTGGFAAALMTGDRSAIPLEVLQDLRRSNLAHLLAISGLHMGLLSGFVFALLRLLLSLIPAIALRLPVKKLAAFGALLVAAGYLALSGGNVATERAFIMVAVMLCAVMLNRRALSLRAVALAALIVLAFRPESLLSPGFQMSFAATTGLIAVFSLFRDRGWFWGRGLGQMGLALVLSSAVAGAATAPYSAAHFNQIAQLGLPANLASVPLMGIWVIPWAVIATLLMPFGLEGWALQAMGLGLNWILGVAHWVAGQEAALRHVPSPDFWVLPLFSFGALALILWQGIGRWVGLVPVFLAIFGWVGVERPAVLIAENGGLVGIMTKEGRALSRAKGGGFVAEAWLENDGDPELQQLAAEKWPDHAALGQGRVITISGKRAAAEASCQPQDWLISNIALEQDLPCAVFDPKTLRDLGSVGVFVTENGIRKVTARELAGTRIWHQ